MTFSSCLARSFGWTPVGRVVDVTIDDSELVSIRGSKVWARVSSLLESGSATLELVEFTREWPRDLMTVIAHPRHRGYDFFHARFGAIAVDVSKVPEGPDQDTRFAIGSLRVTRR